MQIYRYILFALLVFVVGCTTPQHTLELINRSESVAEEHPDSSLLLIGQVDRRTIRGERDMAHYRLVYSEALYHNQIDSDCDSLTRPLFDYYYYSDQHEERARAMYQHGRVMYNSGKNAEAMYALLESEKSLQYHDNSKLLGLVYLIMGNIYGSECLYQNALNVYNISYELFNELNLDYHAICSLNNIAECLYSLQDYERAEVLLKNVCTIAKGSGYVELLSYALHSLCDIYLYTNRVDELGDILLHFELNSCPIFFHLSYNYYCAIYQANLGNKAEAHRLMELADSCPNIEGTSVEYLKYFLYRYLGDKSQALYWLSMYTEQQEEQMLSILELPVLNMQLELLRQEKEVATERAQTSRFKNTIFILVLLIVVLAVGIWGYARIVKQKHAIEEYMSMVNELRLTLTHFSSSENNELKESWSAHGVILNEINIIFETYYEHGNTSREASKIIERVKSIIEIMRYDENSLSQLAKVVNVYHNNILERLKSSAVKLSEKDIKYIIYLLSGFSKRSICLLLDMDSAALSRYKYRVKNKMAEGGLDNEITEIFVKG